MITMERSHQPGPQFLLSANWVQHQLPHRDVVRTKPDTMCGVTWFKSPLHAIGVQEINVHKKKKIC